MEESIGTLMDAFTGRKVVDMACFDALLDALEKVAEAAGVAELEGQTVRDWWNDRRRFRLEQMLLEFEQNDPATAAYIQRLLDQHGHDPFSEETGDGPPA
ncbi:MAG TPA: hypothetical protein VD994_19730 [Prosthecobacter sp.]|nr:hypothetical protein [Prosthecobacter sp.]